MSSDINTITLTGRISQVRELRRFDDGGGAFSFSLANGYQVKRQGQYIEDVNFFDCKLGGKRAVALHPHIYKGLGCTVHGELRTRKYEKDGQQRTAIDVLVRDFTFGAAPKGGRQDSPQPQQSALPKAVEDDPFNY